MAAGAQVLIDRGASPGAATTAGNTALLLACERGHLDTMKLIMAGGADIEKSNAQGFRRVFPRVDDGVFFNSRPQDRSLFLGIGHGTVSRILPGVFLWHHVWMDALSTDTGFCGTFLVSSGEQEVLERALEMNNPMLLPSYPQRSHCKWASAPYRTTDKSEEANSHPCFRHLPRSAKAALLALDFAHAPWKISTNACDAVHLRPRDCTTESLKPENVRRG